MTKMLLHLHYVSWCSLSEVQDSKVYEQKLLRVRVLVTQILLEEFTSYHLFDGHTALKNNRKWHLPDAILAKFL